MRQIELLSLVMKMNKGEAVIISRVGIKEAVSGSFSSFAVIRDYDIIDFIKTIEENWDIRVTEVEGGDQFRITKL